MDTYNIVDTPEDDDRDCGCVGLDTCMECTSKDDYEPAEDAGK